MLFSVYLGIDVIYYDTHTKLLANVLDGHDEFY